MTLDSLQHRPWSEHCLEAVRKTTECADWCIQNDGDPDCIRHCLDAREFANAAARLMALEAPYAAKALETTAFVLERCAVSCDEHRDTHSVFARCAEACQEAAEACTSIVERQA